jgi:hypothetical protein
MKHFMNWLRKAAHSAPRSGGRPRSRKRALGLHVEHLETRLVPVVGLVAVPAPVPAGAYSGVCEVSQPGWYGSGALLYDGQHVLTAAHLVDQFGHGQVDQVTFTVSFDNGAVFQVPASNVAIAPGWDGKVADGNDLAVLTLPTAADPSVERYDMNTSFNEGGQVGTLVGYGIAGFPGIDPNNPGIVDPNYPGLAPYGTKRTGTNAFDAPSGGSKFLTFSLNDANNLPPGVTAANEAIPDEGDSGGPVFLGNRIAGVSSFGPQPIQIASTTTYTRVSEFVGWVNQQIGGANNLDLNLNNFPDGAHQPGLDNVSVGLDAARQNVVVQFNGQVYWNVPLDRVGSITVDDSWHGMSIWVDATLGRQVIVNPEGGETLLTIDGRGLAGESGGATFTITGSDTAIDSYGDTEFHTDVAYPLNTTLPGTNIPATQPLAGLTLYTSNTVYPADPSRSSPSVPDNTINVRGLPSGPTILYDGDSSNTIIVGDANGSLDELCGNGGPVSATGQLTVQGAAGANSYEQITVQNGAAAVDPGSFVLTDGQVTYRHTVGRFKQHTFTLTYAGLVSANGGGSLEVDGGPGGSQITVLGITAGVQTKVKAGAGANSITLGDGTHSLSSVGGPLLSGASLFIDGGSGQSSLVVNDTAGLALLDALPDYQITNAAVNYFPAEDVFTVGQAPPEITFNYKNIQALTLLGGSGGSEIDIQSAPPSLTVRGGTGNNTFVVGAPGLGGLTNVFLNGGTGGTNSVVIDDTGASAPAPGIYSVYSSQIVVGPTLISFFNDPGDPATVSMPGLFNQVTLKTANGRQLVYAYTTASGAATTVDLGTGDQDVNINRLEEIGPLTVHGGTGHDNLLITDFADPQFVKTGPDFIISPTNVSEGDGGGVPYQGFAGVTYDGFAGLVVAGTALSNTFTVLGTAPGVTTDLNGGSGTGNTLDYSLYQGDVSVNLAAGTATGISGGIRNFQNVIGGTGHTVLVGAGTGNTLTAIGGYSLLIAGPGPGTLTGATGNTILVGGSTAYDTNPTALAALMAEWARTDVAYATRVNHLLYGGGLNGSTVLNPTTFTLNAGGNTLMGNARTAGPDLFYGSQAHDTNDWSATSGEVFVDPATFQPTTGIDASALRGTTVRLDGTSYASTSAFRVKLTAGPHTVQPSGGAALAFTVAADGTVDYDASLDATLSGRGTYNLTLKTPNEAFVAAAFQDILGRAPAEAEMNNWSAMMDQGAPAADLSMALAHSAEYYGNVVSAAYQKYLGRAAEPAEVQAWVGLMQQGLTDERLEAGFIGSPEYIQDHGGQGAGWVSGMYQDLLGRTPQQAEVDAWVGAMAAGMSPTQVAYGFAASAEREGQRVSADYQQYVGRAATSTEVSAWVNAFENGFTNEDVIAGFVGSPEYYKEHA